MTDIVFNAFQRLGIHGDALADGENRTSPASAAASSSSLLTPDARPFVPALPRGISSDFPPPGFPPRPAAAGIRQRFDWFDLMTSAARTAEFTELVRGYDEPKLLVLASHVTTDRELFFDLAQDQTGSTNLRRFLGKSSHVDNMFFRTITSLFLPIMKLKYGHYVATQALDVVDKKKKITFFTLTLSHALELAHDENGCVALNEVITAVTGPHRHQLLNLVAVNALWLSMDTSGNFVVQHVLKLHNPFYTWSIALQLCRHYIPLSFQKYGSFIVEKVLESRITMPLVLDELLICGDGELMRLARSEYGNYVLQKALTVTNMHRVDLYRQLVSKLNPFFRILRRGHGKNIVALVETLN